MKKITLLIALTCIFHFTANSQSCLPEGITFTTQAQIDSFQIIHPNCTQILGEVRIWGVNDINNLNGLNVLTSIDSSFIITFSPNLTNLTGLNAITSIGGDMQLYFTNLTSFTGLDSLVSIGGNFISFDQAALTNLTGLGSLTSVGGNFSIESADDLINLTGLGSLTSIGGVVSLSTNPSLTSLSGLDAVTSIGGGVSIVANFALTSITGLNDVTSLGGSRLNIFANNILLSLSGLDNIEPATIDSIIISHNFSLSTCEVESICDYLSIPNGFIVIQDNAPGCNSQDEVEAACETITVNETKFSDNLIIHPNPFTTSTTIEYELKHSSSVQITIYNHLGEQVEVIKQKQSSGKQQVVWNAIGLPSGVYYFQMQAGEQLASRKIMVVK
ncbi:MAG: T9SS type A sorting domain-containing protein [Bacteroidetes bacterium]|nr:T9SS type A sorting domain-containing protein [Bacteroidota bacterium]